ncbi:MAG: hypothetical protein JWN50_186 [Parcubacteria group bacterium]|nr:hypothetical protein [Parcubacteria group bacterium]
MDKLNLRNRFALLLVILIAPFAGVSAAGLIDSGSSAISNTAAAANAALNTTVNATGNSSTYSNGTSGSNTGTHSTSNTSAGLNAGVNANVNGNANTGSNTGTNGTSNTSGSANTGASLDVSGNVSGNVDSNSNDDAGTFTMTRDSADVTGTVGSQVSADNVQSSSDLKAFAATQLRNDQNLSSMAFASDNVEVAYRERAHFLGFIPTSVNVNVTAHNDGTVDVSYPWYSFLMTTNRGDIEAAVKSEVSAYLSSHSSVNVNAASDANTASSTSGSSAINGTAQSNWNASIRAELAARIQAVLRSQLTGDNGNASSTQGSY